MKIGSAYFFILAVAISNSSLIQKVNGQGLSTTVEMLTVSGRVVDSETKTPLPFASLALKNSAKGTITNESGSFQFHIPANLQKDTLVISMIGYQEAIVPIATILGLPIALQPRPVILKEVEISASRISVEQIFQEIKRRIKINYPVDTYAMECFYREIKKEGDTYQSLLEAVLVVQDRGYDQINSEEVAFIKEIRGSDRFVNRYSSFWQENNLLKETLGLNAVHHPSSTPKVLGGDRYTLEGTTVLNNREVYVLVSAIKPDDCWQRTLYVDVENYGILRSEESIRNLSLSWKVDNQDSVYLRLPKGSSTFDFKSIKGKLFLNHIRHEVENEYFNPITKAILQRFTIVNDLVVTDIDTSSKIALAGLKKVENRALEQQLTPYNEQFWTQYNGIRQTPLESKIMNDLMRNGSLDKQFLKSSSKPKKKK